MHLFGSRSGTHVAVSGCEGADGRHYAKGQANPAQHGVAGVPLQDMSVMEDAEEQDWKRSRGQGDMSPLKWKKSAARGTGGLTQEGSGVDGGSEEGAFWRVFPTCAGITGKRSIGDHDITG